MFTKFTPFLEAFKSFYSSNKKQFQICLGISAGILFGILVFPKLFSGNSSEYRIDFKNSVELQRLADFTEASDQQNDILKQAQALDSYLNNLECSQAQIVLTSLYMESTSLEEVSGLDYSQVKTKLHDYANTARTCDSGYKAPTKEELETLFQ